MIMTGIFKVLVDRREKRLRAAEAREREEESRMGGIEAVDEKGGSDIQQGLGYRAEK